MNDTVNLEDIFCAIFVIIKPEFIIKVCNTGLIMLGFDKQFVFNIFTWWFEGKLFR